MIFAALEGYWRQAGDFLMTTAAIAQNQTSESTFQGMVMVQILCKFCRRIQMEVSDDSAATIRWRCKSCKNWNAFEVSPEIPERGRGKLKIKFVDSAGRNRR